MAQSVFFDSQIVTRVSDGIVPESLWKEVIERLAGKYEYCVSFTTLMELVNALAGGDGNHFQQNRNRLLVMTSPAKCRFLPMPGQFIRNTIFGLPLDRPEYSPETITARLDADYQTSTKQAGFVVRRSRDGVIGQGN